MKANGASIVGDERTTPLFRQVPEEVKRRGLRAAGGGEGCWRTLDHGSAALQWAVVDGGRRGQWGGRSGEARPAPAGSRSQWALPSHLEHPLSIHWAATTGGHPLNPWRHQLALLGRGAAAATCAPCGAGSQSRPSRQRRGALSTLWDHSARGPRLAVVAPGFAAGDPVGV